jgi:hypothetical protein
MAPSIKKSCFFVLKNKIIDENMYLKKINFENSKNSIMKRQKNVMNIDEELIVKFVLDLKT